MAASDQIHEFWFGNHEDDLATAQRQSRLWWSKKAENDREIRMRFELLVQAAGRGELDDWSRSAQSLERLSP